MKSVTVKDSEGNTVKGWKFGTTKAVHLGNGVPTRQVSGWSLIAPDGIERFSEGNFQQFIPFANRVLTNYGYQPAFD